jgi:hypothetical protein
MDETCWQFTSSRYILNVALCQLHHALPGSLKVAKSAQEQEFSSNWNTIIKVTLA